MRTSKLYSSQPFRHRESGAIMIMFMIMLPFWLAIIWGIWNMGFLAFQYQEIRNYSDALALVGGYQVLSTPAPFSISGIKGISLFNGDDPDYSGQEIGATEMVGSGCNNANDCTPTTPSTAPLATSPLSTAFHSPFASSANWILGNHNYQLGSTTYAAVQQYAWSQFVPVPALVVIVADYSASMRLPLAGTTDTPGTRRAVDELKDALASAFASAEFSYTNFAFVPFYEAVDTSSQVGFAAYSNYTSNITSNTPFSAQTTNVNNIIHNELTFSSNNGTDMAVAISAAIDLINDISSSWPYSTKSILVISDGTPNWDSTSSTQSDTLAQSNAATAAANARSAGINVVSVLAQHAFEADSDDSTFMQSLAGAAGSGGDNSSYFAAITTGSGLLAPLELAAGLPPNGTPHCWSIASMNLTSAPWELAPTVLDPMYAYFVIGNSNNSGSVSEIAVNLEWLSATALTTTNVSVVSSVGSLGDTTFTTAPNVAANGYAYYNPSSQRMILNWPLCFYFWPSTLPPNLTGVGQGSGGWLKLRWGLPKLYFPYTYAH